MNHALNLSVHRFSPDSLDNQKYKPATIQCRKRKQVQIIGTKFTDLKHDGKIKAEDIIDITDIIEKRHPGRTSDDEIIVYSVGGMPVEDIAWGGTVYRNAVKLGIGIKLPLWDKPEMA